MLKLLFYIKVQINRITNYITQNDSLINSVEFFKLSIK